jgi:hypothetical protein
MSENDLLPVHSDMLVGCLQNSGLLCTESVKKNHHVRREESEITKLNC